MGRYAREELLQASRVELLLKDSVVSPCREKAHCLHSRTLDFAFAKNSIRLAPFATWM